MSVQEIADQADMIVAGINEGKAVGISEATIRFIKNTMLSDSCSVDQAMVKLHIPSEEHQYFKDLLAKEQ